MRWLRQMRLLAAGLDPSGLASPAERQPCRYLRIMELSSIKGDQARPACCARAASGKSTGPRTPEGLERSKRANWKHGYYSREAKTERSRVRAAILALRYLRIMELSSIKGDQARPACCARAASGHAAIPPPSSVMNAAATIYCADHTYATAPQYPHANRPCCLRVHGASRGRALFNSLFSLLPRTTRPFVSRVRQSARLGSGLWANQMQPHVKAWGTEAEPPKFLAPS
jgi:hypothetical protein